MSTQTIPSWLNEVFTIIDYKDAKDLSQFLTDDVEFCFGNQPPIIGRAASIQAISDFFQAIESLAHSIEDVILDDERIVCRGRVTYTRFDGTILTTQFSNWFYLHGDLISRYMVFVDNSELFR